MEITPNEICFLNYINGLDHSDNLPDYWKYTYGINPDKVTKKLIDTGLLEFRINIEANISKLTVPQLKEVLKNNNLAVNGNKNDLIARIFENIDLSYLEDKFSTKRFCLTNNGKQMIQDYYLFIINQKENYNFKDEDILTIYQNFSDKDNVSKLIELFKFVIDNDLSTKNYSDLDLRSLQFYQFYLKIDMYNDALFYIIINYKLKLFNFRTIENTVYLDDVSFITFNDTFIDKLKNIISLTDATETELKNIIYEEQLTSSLPFKYFSNEECYKILLDLLNNKPFNIKNYKTNTPVQNNPNYVYYSFNNNIIDESFGSINIKVKNKSNNFINNLIDNLKRKIKKVNPRGKGF